MKNLLIPIGLWFFLTACSDNIFYAGGKTVETTNGISGIVHNPDLYQARVDVYLYPIHYHPNRDGNVHQTKINTKGEWRFSDIPDGAYNIVFYDLSKKHGSVIQNVIVSEKVTKGLTTELKKTQSLSIPRKSLPIARGDYILIPGTGIYTQFDSTRTPSQQLILNHIPPITLEKIVHQSSNNLTDVNILASPLRISEFPPLHLDTLFNWPYTLKLRLQTSELSYLSSTLYQFPLTLRLDHSSLSFDDWPDKAGVCLKDQNDNPIPLEIEYWSKPNKEAVIWFLADSVSAKMADPEFTLLTGNALLCPEPSTKMAVFSKMNDYLGVWHMRSDSLTPPGVFPDATPFGHDAILKNRKDDLFHSGYIGPGLVLNGVDEHLQIDGLFDKPKPITLSAWIHPDDISKRMDIIALSDHVGIRIDTTDTTRFYYAYYSVAGASNWRVIHRVDSLPPTDWRLFTLIIAPDNNKFLLYINGVLQASETDGIPFTWDKKGNNTIIGAHPLNNNNFYQGKIDEVRISSTARSKDWIRTTYENQKLQQQLVIINE